MIYITPPTEGQLGWRFRAEYAESEPRPTRTFNISEEIAKIFADKGIPVVLMGSVPIGATEEALVDALDELDRRNTRISKRITKELAYAIDLLGEASRLLLPQVYWDCRRAAEAVKEAEERYYEAHEELLKYAATQLGLPEGAALVEGPHECIKSPTRHCLYDHDEDRCHDSCLVCGEPEERK